jgi:hypothetical protein
MATTPFAYNPSQASIAGTSNLVDLSIGTSAQDYSSKPGGVTWWMGPDDSTGYLICRPVPAGNQPTQLGAIGTVRFARSVSKTTQSFLDLANYLKRDLGGSPDLATASDAGIWLAANGYYTNWTPPPTPILYYDPSNSGSYPGTGTTLTDLSGNGRTGTMSNLAFTSPYLTYNGTSSQVSIADNALLEPGSGDFTVEIWVRQSVITGSSRVLIAKTDSGLASGWGYGIRTGSGGSTYFEVGNGSTSISSSSYLSSINTWYQFVGVWTNIASNSIEFYVNGSSQGSATHGFTSVKNTTSPLYIGSFNGGQFSQWLNGRVGVTRLYNKALTATEVLQTYNETKSIYGL